MWVLGDLVAAGYGSFVGWERLSLTANTHFVRGNTEADLTSGKLAAPTLVDGQVSANLSPDSTERVRSVAGMRRIVIAAGWLHLLADLRFELANAVPCGRRLLGSTSRWAAFLGQEYVSA